jgi:hypothetical protein
MKPAISIVVPFFNEEQNVAPLLGEIRAVCDGLGKPLRGALPNATSVRKTPKSLLITKYQ